MFGRRLLGILFFSLCFTFTGIGLKHANAAETLSIANNGSATGSVNQNSAGGWGGQSFVAVDDNFSSVTWKVGTEYNDKYHDDFKLYLRNSSSETIASSTIHLDTPIQFTSGLEVNFALDTPYPTTPSTTYQYIIEISDEPFSYALTDGGIYNDGESLGSAYDMWFEIYTDSTPPSNDYVMYYGNNPVYTPTNSYFSLPVVYNVCDSWSTTTDFYLYLRDDDDNVEYAAAKLLESCSGTVVFDSFSGNTDYTNTLHFAINSLVYSNEFINAVYTPLMDSSSYIHYYYPNGLYIDTGGGSGTTTVNFAYDVCADVNWASSTIYLVNEDSGNTGISFTPTSCTAAASMYFPYSQDLQLTFPASLSYQRSGVEYLSSSVFNVVFYSNTANVVWGDPETATSTSWFAKFTNEWYVKFLNVFPFNIPFLIRSAWLESSNTPLDSDLSFLVVADETGSVGSTFPKEWALSENDLNITLFSESMISQGSSTASDFFDKFRNFTKWLQIFGYVFGVLALAYKLVNDMTENQSDNI